MKRVSIRCLFFASLLNTCIILASQASAQIVKGLDSEIYIERWKSIVSLYSEISGELQIEGMPLTKIDAPDSMYVVNLKPDFYDFKLKLDNDSILWFNTNIRRGKVSAFLISTDSSIRSISPPRYEEAAKDISGRTVFFVPAMAWFLEIEAHQKDDLGGVSIIGGYRFLPWLAIGAGVGLERSPQFKYLDPRNFEELFFPVFLRFSTGIGSRRFTPFYRFDYGRILINSAGAISDSNFKFNIVKGGMYSANGLGLRIGINKNFYGTVFYESKRMHYVTEETKAFIQQEPENITTERKQRFSFLNFSIGYNFL